MNSQHLHELTDGAAIPLLRRIIGDDDNTPELLSGLNEIDAAIATELLDRLLPRED